MRNPGLVAESYNRVEGVNLTAEGDFHEATSCSKSPTPSGAMRSGSLKVLPPNALYVKLHPKPAAEMMSTKAYKALTSSLDVSAFFPLQSFGFFFIHTLKAER
jgi:hypothetical protein